MRHTKFLIILCFFVNLSVSGQADTVFNQTDNRGLKQGHWKKSYPNGKLIYQGYFKDNKPVGLMKRFYESGAIQAIMHFSRSGEKANVQLFYEDGERSAEGTYVNMKKDSLWSYYSFYSGALVSEEFYVKGKKHGVQKSFYENGNLSEEAEFKNGVKEGAWNQYFEDGKPKLKAMCQWNKVNGKYTLYYPSGGIMISGFFDNSRKDGPWVYYEENGKEKYRITYNYGQVSSEDEKQLIEKDAEFFKKVDESIGKFKEPSINDFFQGPQ